MSTSHLAGISGPGDLKKLPKEALPELAQEIRDRIGLAFQIVDDLLNVRSTRRKIGKSAGSDRARGKATAPGRVGAARAEGDAERLLSQAAGIAPRLGRRASEFESLTHYLLHRTH